jgi:phosphohistidine phosphatase
MKLLTLVRHAKSDWENDLTDIERPLNIRGEKDAPLMAMIAKSKLPEADLIISSPAVRAYSTAFEFAKALNYPLKKVILQNSLYHCGISEYLDVLENLNPDIQHAYIFSHNPGTTQFVNFLCNENIFNIPTCGVAHIKLDIRYWSEITRDSGKLISFITPKMIK